MLESASLRNPNWEAPGAGDIRAGNLGLFTMDIPFTALLAVVTVLVPKAVYKGT